LPGPYVSLGAGVSLQQTLTREPAPQFGLDNPTGWQFDPGFAAEFGLGWGFANGLRVELEAPTTVNKVSSVTSQGQRAGGSEVKYGGMVNLLYDFNLGLPVTPYLGIGAGGIEIAHNGFNRSTPGFEFPHPAGDQVVADFGYQAIVGLSYPLSFLPGLAMTAEYRFLGVLDPQPSFHTNIYNEAGDLTANGTTRFSGDYDHSLMLGLRYAFAGSPAAPPPEGETLTATNIPGLEPARTYLVFFDWDRSDLSARARQIIAEAATTSIHVQTTRLEVNGYTDLSGSAQYNKRLSVQRGESVQAELVLDGVPRDEIEVTGLGTKNPLVATPIGVREPQNRRVEIVLH
jgi:outer membrane protein OmpA-like peptidoglycan-associated protein